jgi:hypothetical protein
MNMVTLMAVALAGWINRQQQEDASGLADCSATTTGRRHESDDWSFRTLRGHIPACHAARQPQQARDVAHEHPLEHGQSSAAEEPEEVDVDQLPIQLKVGVEMPECCLDRWPQRSDNQL